MTPNLEAIMKIKLHLDITDDSGVCQSIALGTTDMEATPSIATLGLSLANGKAILSQLQMQVVSAQIAAINAQHRLCPVCQSQRRIKDYHEVNFRLSLIHISEPTRRTPISYAVFCLKK